MEQRGTRLPGTNKIRFRCRTQTYWIEGSISTLSRRLADFLNSDAARQTVMAEDASVMTVRDGQTAKMAIGNTSISTATILLATPVEDAPRPPDLAIRSTRAMKRVIAGVGPYNIVGDVYLLKEATNRSVLLATEQRFIVVADAVLTLANNPAFVQRYSAVCVNRQHVEFISAVVPKE